MSQNLKNEAIDYIASCKKRGRSEAVRLFYYSIHTNMKIYSDMGQPRSLKRCESDLIDEILRAKREGVVL